MSLLSRLNAKFGRFSVPNVTLILIFGQVFLFIAQFLLPARDDGGILQKVQLLPQEVLSGQYWRLVTFLFNPPGSNPLFAFLFWYMFHLMGTTLEVKWGTFRYNVFLLIGYLANVAAAFVVYYATGANLPGNNLFLYGTIFLAFARFYPDFVLNIMFILPVKIRWLALLTWITYGWTLLTGDWLARGMVIASTANFLLFFGTEIWTDIRFGHRRMQFQARALKTTHRIIHKCAVCGLTSETAPQTQFRYCSKCDGERCYCPEHLQNHEHVSQKLAGAADKPR